MSYRGYNRRYGLRGVYTTRQFPRRLRAPLGTARVGRGTYRRFRRLGVGRRRLQNLVVNLNEHKYCDGTIDKDCVDYNGSVWDFTHAIASGAGQSQRVGGKIILSNFRIAGKIYWNWNDDTHRLNWAKHCNIRIIFYLWRDDTPSTITTLLQVPSPPNASLAPFYNYNEEQRKKRKVLLDKTYLLNNDMDDGYYPIAGGNSCVGFNFFLDFRKMPISKRTVSYDATGVAFNGLKMAVIADCNSLAIGGNKGPEFEVVHRLRYTDA